ncbi:hypothetical protein NE235_07890 [Actinoallomurus spadix]|uniref:Uncharacterized protein n=1 Tax=Actinoallomurus spadix TaxID=79912 RepID=A0ABN0X3D2_9ACTN|nr:hypothetical protein [Actinoallomurus spadix]MCO5986026.1 hypothetical protein [Actinoallomurus spadix]
MADETAAVGSSPRPTEQIPTDHSTFSPGLFDVTPTGRTTLPMESTVGSSGAHRGSPDSRTENSDQAVIVRNAYTDSLRLAELLTLRRPRSVVGDLRPVLRDCDPRQADWADAQTRLRRANGVVGLLCQHVQVLDHLHREDFLAFRDRLGTASTAGSTYFGELSASPVTHEASC